MVLLTRRLLVAVASSVVLHPLPVPAVESLAARVSVGIALLDKISANWSDLTISCNYAEADRAMMQNKTLLMEKASVKGAYEVDSSVVVNMCKVDTDAVRPLLAKDSALRKLSPQLTKPVTLSLVEPDDAERYVELAEAYDRAITEASAAMYLSGSGDFNAGTGFKVGERPSAPNLDSARGSLEEARDLLIELQRLLPGAA
jgi:hypothetical protein